MLVHIGGLRLDTPEQKQYADSLKQLAADLNVEEEVIWLGKRNDVQEILPLADIYVHPSRSEGLGSVLMEAAVDGLPLLGTEVGGIPEVVKEGVTGFLVPPNDAYALAESINKMLKQGHEWRGKCGNCACNFVHRHFDQKQCAQELYNLYYK